MRLIIDIPENDYFIYSDYSEREIANDLSYYERIIAKGKPIPDNATRKEVHKLLFGIEPPELGSPYSACAKASEGCEMCRYKDDLNCDVNWWNAPYQKGDSNEIS